jgi:hypothetical protein
MATDTNILTTLRKLSTYYGKEPNKEQARIYLELLAEVEPAALDYAAQEWIKGSPFFPRINELLRTARRYQPPPVSPVQALRHSLQLLERKFWQERILDPQEWEALAARYEIHGCEHQAHRCRIRCQQHQKLIDIEKDPSTWTETCTQTSQIWQHQADLLNEYYSTGSLPEAWR